MRFNIFNRNKEINKAKTEYNEAYPIDTFINMSGTDAKTPMYQFSYRWISNTTFSSDLLRTIIETITNETFKNGIAIKERYEAKCPKCGREFEEDIPVCPFDFTPTVKPSYDEYIILKNFIDRTNSFDEDILTTMRIVDTDVNMYDNGWLLIVKDYLYDKSNNLIGAIPKEVVRLSPAKMKIIMSNYGMGIDDDVNYLYFCPEHRDEVHKFEKEGTYKCPKCGKQMLRAWYSAKDKSKDIYYSKTEVYHIKKWSYTQGYGVPPLYSIWMKVLTLMKMDRFMLEAYTLQRSPKALLLIRGKLDSFRKAWEWLMQKARENPNMIYPLILEGEEGGSNKRIVDYVQFDLKPEEWQWLEMRKEFREVVGLVYGVQPMFIEGKEGSGLQNEGLMIAATNRTIEHSQEVWNDFLEWLSEKIIGVTSYKLELVPNERENVVRDLDIDLKKTQIATMLYNMGYEIEMYTDNNGRLQYRFKRDVFGKKERVNPEKLENAKITVGEEDEGQTLGKT